MVFYLHISLSTSLIPESKSFAFADTVLMHAITSITTIIYSNEGIINLDFADLKTTLEGKGLAHLAIGRAPAGDSVLNAVKECINSPLLETTITGATNLLINTSDPVNLSDLNESILFLKDLVNNEETQIIWGTVQDIFAGEGANDVITVTLIAIGIQDKKNIPVEASLNPITKMPSFTPIEKGAKKRASPEKIVAPQVIKPAEFKLEIPPFLQNRR